MQQETPRLIQRGVSTYWSLDSSLTPCLEDEGWRPRYSSGSGQSMDLLGVKIRIKGIDPVSKKLLPSPNNDRCGFASTPLSTPLRSTGRSLPCEPHTATRLPCPSHATFFGVTSAAQGEPSTNIDHSEKSQAGSLSA
jgi:hypothetical protein